LRTKRALESEEHAIDEVFDVLDSNPFNQKVLISNIVNRQYLNTKSKQYFIKHIEPIHTNQTLFFNYRIGNTWTSKPLHLIFDEL
jgi:hypothetical protein